MKRLFRVHVRTLKGVRKFTFADNSATHAMKFVAGLMKGEKVNWDDSFVEDLGELQGGQSELFDARA